MRSMNFSPTAGLPALFLRQAARLEHCFIFLPASAVSSAPPRCCPQSSFSTVPGGGGGHPPAVREGRGVPPMMTAGYPSPPRSPFSTLTPFCPYCPSRRRFAYQIRSCVDRMLLHQFPGYMEERLTSARPMPKGDSIVS